MEFREGDRVPVRVVSGTGAVTLGGRPVDRDGNEFPDAYIRLWTGDREFEGDPPDLVTAELVRTDSDVAQGRIADVNPDVGRVYREWRRTLEARGSHLDVARSGGRDRGPERTGGRSRTGRASERSGAGTREGSDGEDDRDRADHGYEDEWRKRKSDSMRDLL